ncbi:hypothetical protein XELAEV_18037959mg [Xenopus laevis]|uniref:Secreted protein n=1 Tax=Xenopus laevis TaxID=8355 RepID=A0A974CD56_XENLA|nr:hypothetical protein XELAEV_18037959mg [Xenopus laevis]
MHVLLLSMALESGTAPSDGEEVFLLVLTVLCSRLHLIGITESHMGAHQAITPAPALRPINRSLSGPQNLQNKLLSRENVPVCDIRVK